MTAKQKRFVGEYFRDFDPKAAALRAGYSKENIAREAKRVMEDPAVSQAIERRRNAADEFGRVMDSTETLEHLTNIARDEGMQAKDRIAALRLIGQYHGLFTERHEFASKRSDFSHLTEDQLKDEIMDILAKRSQAVQ